MKIGVALSGCDIGGICAYNLLYSLRGLGFELMHISASGTPAVGALLFASGVSQERCRRCADEFITCCKECDLDSAVAWLGDELSVRSAQGISIHAADICTGKVLAFTNEFSANSECLHTLGIADAYDVLSAAISGVQGLAAYHYCGHKLGDYSARYGHPVYPFGMLGVKRVFSFSFLPAQPDDSYEVLLSQKLMAPPPGVLTHHISRFPPWQGIDYATQYENLAGIGQDGCKNLLLNGL